MQAVTPGAVPFEAAEHLISRGIAVDDEAVRRAMRLAFDEFKIVLEPSGGAVVIGSVPSDGTYDVFVQGLTMTGNDDPAFGSGAPLLLLATGAAESATRLPASVSTRPANSSSSRTAITADSDKWQRRTKSSTIVGSGDSSART